MSPRLGPLSKYLLHSATQSAAGTDDEQPTGRDTMALSAPKKARQLAGGLGVGNHTFHLLLLLLPSCLFLDLFDEGQALPNHLS